MNKFRFNLIRGQVPSPAQRRVRYEVMMLYLGLAGGLLVWAGGSASSRVGQALDLRAQSRQLEKQYTADHDGQVGIQPGAMRLQARMASQMASLRAVAGRLSGDARPARLLRALAVSLPVNMSLGKMALNDEDKSIAFELRVIGSGADGEIGPPALLSRWQQNPAISDEVTQWAYLGSQIGNTGPEGNMVLRFSGRLEKGRR